MGPASAGFEEIKVPINSFSREKQGVSESTYNFIRDLMLASLEITDSVQSPPIEEWYWFPRPTPNRIPLTYHVRISRVSPTPTKTGFLPTKTELRPKKIQKGFIDKKETLKPTLLMGQVCRTPTSNSEQKKYQIEWCCPRHCNWYTSLVYHPAMVSYIKCPLLYTRSITTRFIHLIRSPIYLSRFTRN